MLKRNVVSLEVALKRHEELLDTFVQTPAWKRWLFILDGWSGHKVIDRPKWRPWRRWWTS
jgi:hypothetical protein